MNFFVWPLEKIRDGVWGQPLIVAFEYGGDAGLSGAITKAHVLVEQVPHLYALVKESSGLLKGE